MQVNPRAGLTFANGLRSMMRADPDIIMVGEIRDRETAQIAIESALTGHLVLSTLHTNDAPTAITRLDRDGRSSRSSSPPRSTASSPSGSPARCARTARSRTIVPAQVLRDNGCEASVDIEAYEPVGCGRCGGIGYKGRIGIYEVMTVSEEIRRLILERAPPPTRSPRWRCARACAACATTGCEKVTRGPHVDRRGRARDRRGVSTQTRKSRKLANIS